MCVLVFLFFGGFFGGILVVYNYNTKSLGYTVMCDGLNLVFVQIDV